MTGGKGTNIPASIKARLLKVANEKQIDFQLLLNRYVIERFLYRLSQSPADVVDAVAAFVIPPARAAARGRPFDDHWPAGGPWTPRS
jgi:hypothetical protein